MKPDSLGVTMWREPDAAEQAMGEHGLHDHHEGSMMNACQ